ncbi:hypothetical protein GRS96_19700 (plasmid) [Rathayibacter sp. VKM Ac-2803]|uniref:Uncharacterized protein n=1 Tax=Rathayibacter caricis DSM 15933 TaxID=1328867 RepID=A0A2T4UP68_9MICO|nr:MULTISPECIES: hypothetical protein [Rathayibacter]MWV51493.1 hypothetical protein [Rathayibacter sp. VKM Ac-2803]PTL71318.1 hypothetical protein C1I63_19030 [Rathayibacter caricis DSM 15933]
MSSANSDSHFDANAGGAADVRAWVAAREGLIVETIAVGAVGLIGATRRIRAEVALALVTEEAHTTEAT